MAAKNVKICPCCGRKIIEYKHLLNERLIKGLKVLESVGGEAPLKDLTSEGLLTYSEAANFQKLRYFGLVDKNNRVYKLTPQARRFLKGIDPAPSYAMTVNAQVTSLGPDIFISEITAVSQTREDFEDQII